MSLLSKSSIITIQFVRISLIAMCLSIRETLGLFSKPSVGTEIGEIIAVDYCFSVGRICRMIQDGSCQLSQQRSLFSRILFNKKEF